MKQLNKQTNIKTHEETKIERKLTVPKWKLHLSKVKHNQGSQDFRNL